MTIGERITQLRKEKNISQVALARAIDTSNSQISKWEAGHSYPNYKMRLRLTTFFDVTMAYLLGNTEERTHHPVTTQTITTAPHTEATVDIPETNNELPDVDSLLLQQIVVLGNKQKQTLTNFLNSLNTGLTNTSPTLKVTPQYVQDLVDTGSELIEQLRNAINFMPYETIKQLIALVEEMSRWQRMSPDQRKTNN